VEEKVREHLDHEGLGSPYSDSETVNSVLSAVMANQGGFVEGSWSHSMATVVPAIEKMCLQVSLRTHRCFSYNGRTALHSKYLLACMYPYPERKLCILFVVLPFMWSLLSA